MRVDRILGWLPDRVVALRGKVFEAVNGDDAVTFPNATAGPERFEEIYAHPAANGRSKGAELSDLFWYWLWPGPEVHQEHLEPGARYDEVAAATLRVLSGSSARLSELAARSTASVLDERVPGDVTVIRLRDLFMPVWARYFYQTVFDEPCPPEAETLIVGHADDVVSALKCTRLRHPRRRSRLTEYLRRRLPDVRHELPASLSETERVHYLQGTFFNTGVVQLSEAMAHLLLAVAQHPEVQERLAAGPDDERYFQHVLDETMRLYPLFGIAHRISTDEITLDGETTLPSGTVLCFNYPAYHATGHNDPGCFDPSRWERLSARDAHHIPFGIAANRPCPAWRISPLAMRAACREVLLRFRLASTVSHTRPIPHRAPCLLMRRGREPAPARRRSILAAMRRRDRFENLWRSFIQLGLGIVMVFHARHKRLATRYFQTHDTQGCPIGGPERTTS